MMRLASQNISFHNSSRILAAKKLARGKVTKPYSTAVDDPDFIHQSLLPTDFFQKSLPRLPIPKLEDTCSRYVKSLTPILTPEELANSENIVNQFRDGIGNELNKELIRRDKQNKHTNYVSGAWFDMYLRDRRPICLNQNPFITFNDDTRPEYNSQLIRSTNFLISSARFMKTLRANVLEPEVFHLNPAKTDNEKFRKIMKMFPQAVAFYGAAVLYKAYALDISQYPRLFNSTRIPRPEKDELLGDPNAKHIAVLRKGRFYSFDMLDASGRVIPSEEVLAHLQYILSDNRPMTDLPLPVLTSQHRDRWTGLRQQLVDAGNEASLREVDTAMFVLSLDDAEYSDHASLSRSFLHGDGTNRWFDKSFSLLVAADGKSAVNFEHAWGDGVAVLRYFNEVYQETTQRPFVHPDTRPASIDSSQAVRKIEFSIPDGVKQGITDSLAEFRQTVAGLGMDFMKHEAHTKNDIKKYKLSPDSFLQLAIQMGYYRVFGDTVATYESCSTAAFKHGRTETIRPATAVTKRTCEMFDKASGTLPSVTELQQALKECSTVHGQLTKEAAMGQGFDRHLFGLKTLASETGSPLPDLYQDPAYAKINHNILSTSTLSSPAVLIGGFAPVVPDGFGVGYGINDEYLGCNITSYPNNPPHRSVEKLVSAIEDSVVDMSNIMEGRPLK